MIIENTMVTNITTSLKHFLNEVEMGPVDSSEAAETAHRKCMMHVLTALSTYVNVAQMEIDPDPRARLVREAAKATPRFEDAVVKSIN